MTSVQEKAFILTCLMSEDVIEGVGDPVDDDMAAEMTAAADDTCMA